MSLDKCLTVIMFTDIKDSTGIKGRMGDDDYLVQVKRPHDERLHHLITSHKGKALKSTGDGCLAVFGSSIEAVHCAVELQDSLKSTPISTQSGPVQVRVGLHTGHPIIHIDEITKQEDGTGIDVDQTARIQALALEDQILVSSETASLVRGMTNIRLYEHGRYMLKGIGAREIFEVLWGERTPRRPPGGYRGFTPPVRGEFIGREEEIRGVIQDLQKGRLVSLVAMGGMGKTRVALEVGIRVSGTKLSPDGIAFVEFSSIPAGQDNDDRVLSAFAAQLNLDTSKHPPLETLLNDLRRSNLLLILDSCEAAQRAIGGIARKVLEDCPGVRIMATSQMPLGLSDVEKTTQLQPMTIPAQGVVSLGQLRQLDSFNLFAARAGLHCGWEPTEQEAGDIAKIIRILEAIPLAIELAAQWVVSQSTREIAQDLECRRDEILKQLGAEPDSKRHASMRACLDYTFDHLSESERTFATEISIFSGRFSRQAAEQITSNINSSSLLQCLCERTLLERSELYCESRYALLGTLRDYLRSRLSSKLERKRQLRLRHAAWFHQALNELASRLEGREYRQACTLIESDLENIRLGMESAAELAQHELVIGYATAIGDFLAVRGLWQERFSTCEAALEAAKAMHDDDALALCQNNLAIVWRQFPTGDRKANLRRAIAYCRAAMRIRTKARSPLKWAQTQHDLGTIYYDLSKLNDGDYAVKAIKCFEAALTERTEDCFPKEWAYTQNNLGIAYANLKTGDRGENLHTAIQCFEAALRVFTEEFPVQRASTLNNIANSFASLPTGDRKQNLRTAITYYNAVLQVHTEREFPADYARTQANMGYVFAELQDPKSAVQCWENARRAFTAAGYPNDAAQMSELIAKYA